MRLACELRNMAPRLAAGAVIVESGLSKRGAGEETATQLHGMAAGTYPVLEKVPPKTFARLLSSGEIALGTALLLPLVPTALAGAGLAAFSAGLLGLYLRTPGMRRPGSLRPTQAGTPLAKDIWLLGIGIGLVADVATRERR
ncbi:hypothetical protein [Actinomadura sp. 9N407]|uniref:hypothetical protein n=1 Tax=Actinomadura sp. 9N407 TaxID=3375154 RepID=UPI0037B504B7